MPRKSRCRNALILLSLLCLLVSCRNAPSTRQEGSAVASDTLVAAANLFRYAQNVTAVPTDYGYRMEVLNPWDPTQQLGRFALLKEGCSLGPEAEAGLVPVALPVQSVISFSSTQWSIFLQMNEIDRVKGILEGRYVHDPRMQDLLAKGVVKDVGTESAKDIELMIQMHPDILLYSPYFDGNQDPLKVTGTFRKCLVAWKASNDPAFGAAEIWVDGKMKMMVHGAQDKWGQSEVVLALDEAEAAEHTIEIRVKDRTRKFTVTAIGIQ